MSDSSFFLLRGWFDVRLKLTRLAGPSPVWSKVAATTKLPSTSYHSKEDDRSKIVRNSTPTLEMISQGLPVYNAMRNTAAGIPHSTDKRTQATQSRSANRFPEPIAPITCITPSTAAIQSSFQPDFHEDVRTVMI